MLRSIFFYLVYFCLSHEVLKEHRIDMIVSHVAQFFEGENLGHTTFVLECITSLDYQLGQGFFWSKYYTQI